VQAWDSYAQAIRDLEPPPSEDPWQRTMWLPIQYTMRSRDEWDTALFDTLFRRFTESLSPPPPYAMELVCPLAGFVSDRDLILGDSLKIAKLDDVAISSLIGIGVGVRHLPPGIQMDVVSWHYPYAIFYSYSAENTDFQGYQQFSEVMDTLAMLQAFQQGRVELAGGMAAAKNMLSPPTTGWMGNAPAWNFRVTYSLAGKRADEFQNYYKGVDRLLHESGKSGQKKVALCISRLASASTRIYRADKLLDCCFVAELFFAGGPGSAGYKAALRAAEAAHSAEYPGGRVFDVVYACFDYRNKIAHGGGAEIPDGLVDEFDGIMRHIARRSFSNKQFAISSYYEQVDESIKSRLFR
jgi:hypothetical protein